MCTILKLIFLDLVYICKNCCLANRKQNSCPRFNEKKIIMKMARAKKKKHDGFNILKNKLQMS